MRPSPAIAVAVLLALPAPALAARTGDTRSWDRVDRALAMRVLRPAPQSGVRLVGKVHYESSRRHCGLRRRGEWYGATLRMRRTDVVLVAGRPRICGGFAGARLLGHVGVRGQRAEVWSFGGGSRVLVWREARGRYTLQGVRVAVPALVEFARTLAVA